MGVIPLGLGDWELRSEDILRIKARNVYLIDSPASPDNVSRIVRPSLSPFLDISTDPIRGFWYEAGSIGDRWLIVHGEKIAVGTVGHSVIELGTLPGSGYTDFASVKSRALVVRDGIAYFTDGVTLGAAVSMPLGEEVESVTSINNYFLLTVKDSDTFYWILPDETTVDPFDFATAERSPDPLKAVRVIFDEIWFLGYRGPEVWQATGDSDIPFTRINGRVYDEGCESFTTVASVLKNSLPALIWVTPNRTVTLAQGQVARISNISVEELLETATNLRAWPFRTKKSDFYILCADEFTLAYNIQRNEWYRWDTYGYDFWRANLSVQAGTEIYVGDALTGKVWRLANEGFDDTDTPIVKEVVGLVLNPGDPAPCHAVNLRMNAGWTGSYVEPELIELIMSDNLGATWADPIPVSVGLKGEYELEVEWRSLGPIFPPGRVFRFRHTGRSRLRIDYAVLNPGMKDGE